MSSSESASESPVSTELLPAPGGPVMTTANTRQVCRAEVAAVHADRARAVERSSSSTLVTSSSLSGILMARGRCSSAYLAAGRTSTSCASAFSSARRRQRRDRPASQRERGLYVEDLPLGVGVVPGSRGVIAGEEVNVAAERAGDVRRVRRRERREGVVERLRLAVLNAARSDDELDDGPCHRARGTDMRGGTEQRREDQRVPRAPSV